MKYCIVKLYPKDTAQANNGVGYYTHQLLDHIVRKNGHTIIPEDLIEDDTILVISICTLDSIPLLKRYREKYSRNIIITGGQFAFMFHACLIWSDFCSVGEGFETFACQSLEEIKELDCVTWKGKNKIVRPSAFIDWKLAPVASTKKKHFYYWKGVGCRNKCRFCFTSWSKEKQDNDTRRVEQVAKEVKKRGGSLTLISNEYDENIEVSVKDMMLKQFLITPLPTKMPKLIRLGIEFANEDTRRKYGKPFTNEQFYEGLDKAAREGKELNLFFITGLEPLQELENLILGYGRMGTKPKIFIKLTNIVFTQFTPIHKERFDIKVENYATPQWADQLKKKLNDHGRWRFRILSTAYPMKALYETAMYHIKSEADYEITKTILNEKSAEKAANILKESGLLNNDFSEDVEFWYQTKRKQRIDTKLD